MKPVGCRVLAIRASAPLLQVFVRLWLVFAVIHAVHESARAQAVVVDARVASVSGLALLSRAGSHPVAISPGVALLPGDAIDTKGGGSLTIELSDGSVVIVQPGSHVVLKDYRTVSSLRELLDVALGRVRLKINHFGGRPNPYRINSPTASIAVRGTEFSVEVNALGDTQVVVYEGLVEAVSLTDPRQKALVESGRSVIIRANQEIRFIASAQAREFRTGNEGQEPEDRTQGNRQNSRSGNYAGQEDESPRETASTYQHYVASLSEVGQMPFYMRFMAFPDSHLDSLQNPAYATEFSSAEGRIFLLPSFSGASGAEENQAAFGSGAPQPIDYTISPQGSFFAPIARARAVVGGGVAASHSGIQLFSANEGLSLTGPLFPVGAVGTRDSAASTASTFVTGTLAAARRFGASGRTSIGAGLDLVTGQGSLLDLVAQSDASGLIVRERIESASTVRQALFKLGLTRDLGRGHKLGMLYRYGVVAASDAEKSHTLNGAAFPLDSTSSSGRSSEIGLRLRGPLTRRLFYGIDSSWLSLSLDDRLRRAIVVDAHQGNRINRMAFGAGLGFALSPRVVFSLDAAGGGSHTNSLRREDATGNLLENRADRIRFFSLHGAVQADVWRQLFVSTSFLALRESHDSNLAMYPDRFGRLLTGAGLAPVLGPASGRSTFYFSDFGVGWRFSQNFLAQYVLSTDYGLTSPSHTLLLRYTFGFHRK